MNNPIIFNACLGGALAAANLVRDTVSGTNDYVQLVERCTVLAITIDELYLPGTFHERDASALQDIVSLGLSGKSLIGISPNYRTIANDARRLFDSYLSGAVPYSDPGAIGPMGPAGPAGPAGNDGIEGATGPAGSQGPAGTEGSIGPSGPAGIEGPVGPMGPVGATGGDGIEGPIGPAGPTGAPGSNGTPGEPGIVGPTGPTGPVGPTGPAGPSGTGVSGSANIDFGSRGTTATVTVEDIRITAGSIIAVNLGYVATASNTADNHALVAAFCKPVARNIIDGSFSIYGLSLEPLSGVFTCQWIKG